MAKAKKKRKPKKTTIINKNDELARQLCYKRGACEMCGRKGRLEWCHIFGRRAKSMRWSMDNCLAMCSTCHRWQTENPLAFNDWFDKKYPGRKARLQKEYNKARPLDVIELLKIQEELHAQSSDN